MKSRYIKMFFRIALVYKIHWNVCSHKKKRTNDITTASYNINIKVYKVHRECIQQEGRRTLYGRVSQGRMFAWHSSTIISNVPGRTLRRSLLSTERPTLLSPTKHRSPLIVSPWRRIESLLENDNKKVKSKVSISL